MTYTIQLRRDTASNWTTDNPVLSQGEVGVETDTGKAKLGTGTITWNSLPYWNTGGVAGGVTSAFGRTGAVVAQSGDYTAAQVGAQPVLPHQFFPESYGGKADGRIVSDGAMSSSSSPNNLVCAASNPFTSADVGKTIWVYGAGASGADLITTVATYVSASTVTLTAACATTVSAHGVAWGTDNGAAIKSAHNAAWAYAQANPANKAQVVFNNGVYVVGSGIAWSTGATFEGNALFPFPLVSASGATKVTVDYVGLGGDVCSVPHWTQSEPQFTGSTVLVLRNDGAADTTYGPPSVFGGPINTYGGEPGTYTNISVTVNQVCIAGPFNPTFGGWDFFGCAQAFIANGSFMPLGIVPSGGAWPQLNQASITHTGTGSGNGIGIWALRMPSAGNNDRCDVGYWSAYGICYGYGPSEHSYAASIRCNYCINGIEPYAGNGTSAVDGMTIVQASVEACSNGIGGFDGASHITIHRVDIETLSNIIYDPSGHLQGHIGVGGQLTAGYNASGVYSPGTGLGVAVTNLNNSPGPVASPQAPPANNAAWVNAYYLDAWITLTATTITAVKIDAVAQGISGSPATYSFLLPRGHSYTPTFTGTLTHTVTLL